VEVGTAPLEAVEAPRLAPGQARILVAEDNDFNAQLLHQLLSSRGYQVRIASTGLEALGILEASVFDLLLLDVHMPELDGFHVVQKIRERERGTGRRLPVVAVTARARSEDRARCLGAGMDDFLIKPISGSLLWSTIEQILGPPLWRGQAG
jgi:CheY-like chemotaxis protein